MMSGMELMNAIFLAATIGVGPFWFLMALRPRATITHRLMRTPWPVVGIGLVYASLVVPNVGAILETLLNPTLTAISASLATPEGSLAVRIRAGRDPVRREGGGRDGGAAQSVRTSAQG